MVNDEYKIKILALGGLGEIGKNTYLFEIDNKIIVVDAGVLFPDDSLLGIDYVIPDYSYLVENQSKIACLIITHGHEDHIGGIPFLYQKVHIPVIYASGIAIDFLEAKIKDDPNFDNVLIEEFKTSTILRFGDFEITFIRVNHSIPDSYGIVFKTKIGSIFHTGDFKIDLTPVGPRADYSKLVGLNGNCILMLTDSTNACVTTPIQSESKIGDSLDDMFDHIKGRIIIVTFSSNIYRIQQIIKSCENAKRKLCIFGTSMEKAIEAGQEAGYITPAEGLFVKPEMLYMEDNDKLVLLCTGSQGEPLSALSRIASGTHKYVKPTIGDTVIYSSSPIPGNQESINKTVNQLYKRGCEVIINSPISDTHTSGHGNANDIKLLLNLVNPKFYIPVHGERHMLKANKALAMDCGVLEKNILIIDNGEVACLTKDRLYVLESFPVEAVYIDGTGVGDIGPKVLSERRKLADDGMFVISIGFSKSAKMMLCEPQILSRGFLYMKNSVDFTDEIINLTKNIFNECIKSKKKYNIDEIATIMEEALQKEFSAKTKRKPIIMIVISNLDEVKQ